MNGLPFQIQTAMRFIFNEVNKIKVIGINILRPASLQN